MVQTTALQNIDKCDVYHDIRHAVAVNVDYKLDEHARLLSEDSNIDENYRIILLSILSKGGGGHESRGKRKKVELDDQTKHDRGKLSRDMRQNEISATQQLHNQECAKNSTVGKSRNKARNVDSAECLRANLYRNAKVAKSAMENQKVGVTIAGVENRNKTSDVQILDGAALFSEGIKSPFVSSTKIHDNEKSSSSHACKDTEFRRQLLEFLRRAYDKDEYARLRKAAESGLYFQHHPDLKKQISEWRYKPRKLLTILRGFFYWLQNASREGAFEPWKDSECLAVEPPPL